MELALRTLLVFSMPLSGAWAANTPLPIPPNASGAPLAPVDLGSLADELRGGGSVGDTQLAGSLAEHLTGATPPDPLLPLVQTGVQQQDFVLPLALIYRDAQLAAGERGVQQVDARLLALVHEPLRAQVLPALGEGGATAGQDLVESARVLAGASPEAQRAFVDHVRAVRRALQDGTLQQFIDGIGGGARQEAPPVPEGAGGYRGVVDEIAARPAAMGSWANAEDAGPAYAIQLLRALRAATGERWRLINGGGAPAGGRIFVAREESLGTDAETIVDPTYLRYFEDPATLGEPQIFVGTRAELIQVFVRHRDRIRPRFMEGNITPTEFVELRYGFGNQAARRRDVTGYFSAEEPVVEARVAADAAPRPAPVEAVRARLVLAVDMLPGNPDNPLRSLAVGRTIVIGRQREGAAGTLRVRNPNVSHRHATIQRIEERYRITDLSSRQGTYFQTEGGGWERFAGFRDFRFGEAVRLGGDAGFAFTLPDPNLPPAERPEAAAPEPPAGPARLVSDQELHPGHPRNPLLGLQFGQAVEIGRSPRGEGALQIGLEHDVVSRRHARVERTEEGYRIADLDSEQGTYSLDEEGIWRRLTAPRDFRPGEAVRLGEERGLAFVLPGAAPIGPSQAVLRLFPTAPFRLLPAEDLVPTNPGNPFLALEPGQSVEIGRLPDAGAFLFDFPGTSRRHARITRTAAGWRVEDLDSTFGTHFLNRRGIWERSTGPREFHPGETVRLGSDDEATFVFPVAVSAHPPAAPVEARMRDLNANDARNPLSRLAPGETALVGRRGDGGEADIQIIDAPTVNQAHFRVTRTEAGFLVESLQTISFVGARGSYQTVGQFRLFYPGDRIVLTDGRDFVTFPGAPRARGRIGRLIDGFFWLIGRGG